MEESLIASDGVILKHIRQLFWHWTNFGEVEAMTPGARQGPGGQGDGGRPATALPPLGRLRGGAEAPVPLTAAGSRRPGPSAAPARLRQAPTCRSSSPAGGRREGAAEWAVGLGSPRVLPALAAVRGPFPPQRPWPAFRGGEGAGSPPSLLAAARPPRAVGRGGAGGEGRRLRALRAALGGRRRRQIRAWRRRKGRADAA